MRVALTGGASGIGAEVLAQLKRDGHYVSVFDISKPSEDADQWIETDFSNPTSIDSALSQVTDAYDVLINNAGLPPRHGLEKKVLLVNFLGFRSFLEGMLEHLSSEAVVVNVASRAGAHWRENLQQVKALLDCNPGNVGSFVSDHQIDYVRAYNLSKEAVIAYTVQQAGRMTELGFRMNSVSPAAVSTGILKDFQNAFGDKVASNISKAGRAGKPLEIADVILFLASDKSSWIKGQDIVIDGGMTAMALSEALDL